MPQTQQVTTHCPPLQSLMSYSSGSLLEEDADSVIAHLEICPRCQRQVDELTHREDSLLKAMRIGPQLKPLEEEGTKLANLINKACVEGGLELASKSRESQGKLDSPQEQYVALDEFMECLEKSHLMHQSEIEFLIESIEPIGTSDFARELVRRERLTAFQAKALKRGRFKGLV